MAHTQPPIRYAPAVGELVWDRAGKRVGEVMDDQWSRYQLRLPGGGIEWHAAPADIRPATRAEVLAARVAAANAESRRRDGHR
ncbi:hypothetical protein [Streptomyces sp. ISL-11]|uniref:hypothetical protein n=1 Tax=Streptomyces sp. ISL-11 TaxID=2819174 RepID=UPI001BE83F3A|nr:hypothetical protein [Streptomyces sp. ISL-11]MBT2383389.1 hypothetical protein [Streptomyces sp. ISL-11]